MIQSMPFSTARGVNRIVCPILLLLFLSLPVAHAGDWTGNVSGYVGRKLMDDSDWPNLDQQFALGVLFNIIKKEWPVSIAADIPGSGDEHEAGSRELKGYTPEEYIGVRKIFELRKTSIRHNVGGGLALISARLEDKDGATELSEDDTDVGAWSGVGMYAELTSHFIMGLDVRYSKAEATLLSEDREAGGLKSGITIGYHWYSEFV